MKFYRPIFYNNFVTSKRIVRELSGLSSANISYLEVHDKFTGKTRKVAYERTIGSNHSEVLYIPGFMSSMSAVKAEALFSFCKRNNITYTRYDPCGLGSSKSISLGEVRLSHWIQDAESVLSYCKKPQVVVASSLGSWISLKLYQKYPENFQALVLLAPGVNISLAMKNRILQTAPKLVLKKLERGEVVEIPHPEYGTFPVSFAFTDDMFNNEIDLSKLSLSIPVRIIQGTKDVDIPYEQTIDLMEKLKSNDVQLTLIKNAHHRLSTEKDINVILDTVSKLIQLGKEK